jgi:cytochrome c oxidase subunit III
MASQGDVLRRQRARAAQLRVVKSPDRGSSSPAHPIRIPNAVLGVLIFLGAEAMLFAGLISACLVLRAGSAAWPPLDQPRLPVVVTAVNTFILLCSGYTMWCAHAGIRRGHTGELQRWLGVSALLGGIFLLVQGTEWVQLIRYGLTGVYGGVFYTLIGCHGLHVIGALIAVLVVLRGTARGQYTVRSHAAVTACQLYWFFVVAVWPVLYVLVYLV